MSTVRGDLASRIVQQRRRINARLQPDPRWPLSDEDRTELEAINALLFDIERAINATRALTSGEQ